VSPIILGIHISERPIMQGCEPGISQTIRPIIKAIGVAPGGEGQCDKPTV